MTFMMFLVMKFAIYLPKTARKMVNSNEVYANMENGKNAIDNAINGMDASDLKTILVSERDGGTAGDVVGNISASDLKSILVGEQVLCNEGGNKFSYVVRINQENA